MKQPHLQSVAVFVFKKMLVFKWLYLFPSNDLRLILQ